MGRGLQTVQCVTLPDTLAVPSQHLRSEGLVCCQEWEDALIKHKVMDAPLDHAKMRYMLQVPPSLNHSGVLGARSVMMMMTVQMKREDEAFLEQKYRESDRAHENDTLEELEV